MEKTNTSGEILNAGQVFFNEKDYWLDKLSGELVKNYFPYDHKTDVNDNLHNQKETFTLDQEVFARLMQLRNNSDPRLHMVLVAVIGILIHRCTDIDDIIVGSTIDKQDSDEEFINTILPLRNRVEDHMTFKQFLIQVKESVSGAIENQNYSIEELFNQLNRDAGGNRDTLFDVAVLLENIQDKKYLRNIRPSIIFSFTRTEESIHLEVEYRASLYKKDTIQRIIKQFALLLEIVIFNVDIQLSSIRLLTPEEKKELVVDFNKTRKDDPGKKTVHELFAARAEEIPGAVALIQEDREVSYGELNRQANRLARTLKSMGVGPETIVGFILPPSIRAVTGILGILKAGGAFLPMAPDLPLERIRCILKDSQAELVLTTGALAEEKDLAAARVLLLDESLDELLDGESEDFNREDDTRLETGYELSNLAYIIYTSGTTGNPKGVSIEHGALVNYTRWAARQYVKNEKSNFPLYTHFSFDLTVTSLFTPLVTGNTIFIYRGEEKEFLIEKIFADNKVEVVKLTPVHLMLTRHLDGSQSQIKRFIVGGEQLETQLAQRIHANFKGNIEIYNEYGPTEATVGCMIYKFNPQKDNTLSIPIGSPADNVQIYLLDRYYKNVPPCGIGELYIGGNGLARGYLNNPGLTAEKFIPNPFQPGKKLYKTGDRARRLADGNIEFLGREDQQVKIRGYRIETGEVESCLLKHQRINHAVVLAKDDGNGYKHLAAYIVPSEAMNSKGSEQGQNTEFDIEELRNYLSGYLPDFMIPSYFLLLDRLPLTVNGKVDRKSLPEPGKNAPGTGAQYQPPTTELEKLMVEIWQDVMGVERVGINDSYFALGGDSIKAIQISARLNNVNWKLELKDLFQYTTIKELVNHIKPVKEISCQEIIEGEVKLTPIQEWFFERNFTDEHHFNQSVMLHRPEGFDEEITKKVFNKITEHHDALRMVFKRENGKITQINRGLSDGFVDIEVFDIRSENDYKKVIAEKCSRVQASIDLRSGPLVKLGLFKSIKGDYLLIAIHHLVLDTVSWRILSEDFASLYQQIDNGVEKEKLEISLKSTSYKEWAEKLYEYANSEKILKELEYWQKIENTAPIAYFKNKGKIKGKNNDNRQMAFTLTEEYTEKLLKKVNSAYNTEISDILLAALGLAVNNWTGAQEIPLIMEGHGREEIIPGVDITRTVGWFASLYPVVLKIKNRDDVASLIKDTKEMLRNIPYKGIGYGILRYLTGKQNKQDIQLGLNPEISFNYLGQFDEDINSESFRAADISSGNSVSINSERIYSLYILGNVFNMKLRISAIYDDWSFKENEIRFLLDSFERSLRQIIDHCMAKKETELTLSDYSASIDEKEIGQVFDILGGVTLEG